MVILEEMDDWFKTWIGKSKQYSKPKVVEEEKPKQKPSPKTKTSEEIFKNFEWNNGPKYTYTYKTKVPPKVYIDPNLMEGYRIFCIDETVSKKDIKSRYHDLAKKYHPDYNKSSSASKDFINLKKWYEYLLKHHVQKVQKP